MNMPQVGTGDIVALAAIIIAAWSAYKTDKFNKRQTAFEETNERLNLMLIERETAETFDQKRADISANFVKVGKSDFRLKIFNRGKGTASNVRLNVMDDSDLLSTGDIGRKFPAPLMEQHSSIELIGRVHMSSPNRVHIKLIWDDATGVGHEKELHPSW